MDHFAVQNGVQKRKINFFDKIAIFHGFGQGLGRVLGGVGEGFGRFWEDFDRSGGSLGAVRALCWVLRVFLYIFCIFHAFLEGF